MSSSSSTWLEKAGTFENARNMLQAFEAAIPPSGAQQARSPDRPRSSRRARRLQGHSSRAKPSSSAPPSRARFPARSASSPPSARSLQRRRHPLRHGQHPRTRDVRHQRRVPRAPRRAGAGHADGRAWSSAPRLLRIGFRIVSPMLCPGSRFAERPGCCNLAAEQGASHHLRNAPCHSSFSVGPQTRIPQRHSGTSRKPAAPATRSSQRTALPFPACDLHRFRPPTGNEPSDPHGFAAELPVELPACAHSAVRKSEFTRSYWPLYCEVYWLLSQQRWRGEKSQSSRFVCARPASTDNGDARDLLPCVAQTPAATVFPALSRDELSSQGGRKPPERLYFG